MADFMKILQQAKDMQDRFQKVQEELQQITVSGSAGGGMVTADVNGTGQIKKIKLDSSVVNPGDIEMLVHHEADPEFGVAFLAGLFPALRATRVDPLEALRVD